MSVKNFVQCGLVTPVATNTTELVLNTPAAPYQLPPLDGGTLVIADSVARPSFYEIISYTHRIDNVIYGVVRAKEGTTARAWTGTTWVYQALTAADYIAALMLKADLDSAQLTGIPTAPTAALGTNTNQIATMAAIKQAIDALINGAPGALDALNEFAAALGNDPNFATTMTNALAGKEPSIAAGTSAQMWLGNKTWASVLSQVQGTLLTGLPAGSNATIVATDTLIGALAKIQNQLNNKCASSDSRLSDAREWTAATVTQAVAEAGTDTTRTAWTAQRVAQAVRGNILTGLNVTVTGAVAATDTLLTAIGKLQKQINDAATALAGNVRATVLTGYLAGNNAALADTDSVLAAFGKVQGQLNGKADSGHTHSYLPLAGGTLTGTLNSQHIVAVGTGNDYHTAGCEVVGNGSANTVFPTIGFHQPTAYAASLQLRGPSDFRFYEQGAGAYANVTANNFNGATCSLSGRATVGDVYSNGWLRTTGVTGWYSETYGGGIYMADSTYVRTYNSKSFLCGGGVIRIEGTNPQVQLWDSDHGILRYLYADGGNVGFLTSGGGWALMNDNAGNTTATGNVTAYSDIRLKTDIEVIPDALWKVRQLRGVTYERIDSGERQTGVIAQEVQAVLPEAVMTMNNDDKTLSVAYGNMVGLLIEAIKELNTKVDNQARELAELRA